jgi:hypothetical protein
VDGKGDGVVSCVVVSEFWQFGYVVVFVFVYVVDHITLSPCAIILLSVIVSWYIYHITFSPCAIIPLPVTVSFVFVFVNRVCISLGRFPMSFTLSLCFILHLFFFFVFGYNLRYCWASLSLCLSLPSLFGYVVVFVFLYVVDHIILSPCAILLLSVTVSVHLPHQIFSMCYYSLAGNCVCISLGCFPMSFTLFLCFILHHSLYLSLAKSFTFPQRLCLYLCLCLHYLIMSWFLSLYMLWPHNIVSMCYYSLVCNYVVVHL